VVHELIDREIRQAELGETFVGLVCRIHELVDKPWNPLRGKCDDECIDYSRNLDGL